jgi:hypothetical protein
VEGLSCPPIFGAGRRVENKDAFGFDAEVEAGVAAHGDVAGVAVVGEWDGDGAFAVAAGAIVEEDFGGDRGVAIEVRG